MGHTVVRVRSTATDFRLMTIFGGSQLCTGKTVQLVVCGVRRPVQLKAPEQGPGHARRRCSGRVPPPGVCENLKCALELLADQQTGGHGLVNTICEGLEEQNITKELKWFIQVDNNGVVKIGNFVRQRVLSERSNPRRGGRVDSS